MTANLGRNRFGQPQQTIEIDGAWFRKTKCMGMAWVIKTRNSNAVHGRGSFGMAKDTLHSQALACLHGFKWVIQKIN